MKKENKLIACIATRITLNDAKTLETHLKKAQITKSTFLRNLVINYLNKIKQ